MCNFHQKNFPYALKSDYEASLLCSDGGVDKDVFVSFKNPSTGKIFNCRAQWIPSVGSIPPPIHDELVAQADTQKPSRIAQANENINSKQCPSKAAIGRLNADEQAQYNLWLDYLDAPEAVDAFNAPDIKWPTPPV
ncbi:TPA: tail fiber assembly protein [Salmonella enterica]